MFIFFNIYGCHVFEPKILVHIFNQCVFGCANEIVRHMTIATQRLGKRIPGVTF
jgi:hypothetical protein